ncbi:MAG TPA: hypothetical protein VLC53_09140 [Myxococcota bacterium]|nr:hypothetical protein [Myxococcota bacterium]
MRAPLRILAGLASLLAVGCEPSAQVQSPGCPPAAGPVCELWRLPALVPAVLAGDEAAVSILSGATGLEPPAVPLVPLAVDPNDGVAEASLSARLTSEQEALLGCGPLWGTDCSRDGIDLHHAEASVLVQAWVGAEGAYTAAYWNGQAHPGTIGFVGGARSADDRLLQLPGARSSIPSNAAPQLPGARGPFLPDGVTPDPYYHPSTDGTVRGLFIPWQFGASAGQPFRSEMAVLSWNFLHLLVAFSGAGAGTRGNAFDPRHPYAVYDPNDPDTSAFQGQCSFLQPQYCSSVRAFFDLTQPPDPPAPPPPPTPPGGGVVGFGRYVAQIGARPKGCLPPARGLARLGSSGAGQTPNGRAGRCPAR